MGLLKFLLIAILVLWLLRLTAQVLFPWAMRKFAQKIMGETQQRYHHMNGHSAAQSQSQQQKPEGQVTIDYVPPKAKPKKGPKKAGEFVDFEEIK